LPISTVFRTAISFNLFAWSRLFNDHVSAVKGRTVRLLFHLLNADLYSFWFEP